MSRFNSYFNNVFKGCPRLGFARDEPRQRNVCVYAIPGEANIVGCYDGVDVWIAPASQDPFKIGAVHKLDLLNKGARFDIEDGSTRIRFNQGELPLDNPNPPRERKRVIQPPPPPPARERKRVIRP